MPLVIDVETTGVDPTTDNLVELAVVSVDPDLAKPTAVYATLINPGVPMPPVAQAVHHISDEMVKLAPGRTEALLQASIEIDGYDSRTLAAHYAQFDSSFMQLPFGICTWRCAHHIWPDAPAYGNQVLRYWVPNLDKDVRRAPTISMPERFLEYIHRALPDAWVTAHLLCHMLRERSVQELIALTGQPILHKVIPFGMHKGTEWASVPRDYIRWLLRQPDLDPDVRYTAEQYR